MRATLSGLAIAGTILASSSARAQTLDPGVAGELTFNRLLSGLSEATAAEYLPDGRLVILRQNGQILVYTGTGQPSLAGTVPVDYDGAERGLLGLAIDPMFATSNRIYFYYSADNVAASNRNRVAWATIDPATNMVDVANRTDILTGIYGPRNHDGGGITFGPDGHLYVGAGDTGCNCGCPPGQADNYFATCLTNLSGKIMRVDRDGGIPASNPLVGVAAVAACGATPNFGQSGCNKEPDQSETGAPRTEIYNWGFRNPWRLTFDPLTRWLWIGDVGEVTWEEVTISKGPGEHHGWPMREGFHGQATTTCQTVTPQATGPCVEPVLEYNHSEGGAGGGASITGGVFSHHCSWPDAFRDNYWFADYVFDRIWMVRPNATRDGIDGQRVVIATGASSPVHFFLGLDGSMNFISKGPNGYIGRFVPSAPAKCEAEDAGAAMDAAPPPVDSGPAPADDATVSEDAADPTPADAAAPADDATVSPPPADAGAQPAPDAGGTIPPAGGDSGCGCSTSRGAQGSAIALAVLAMVMVRRRRR